MDKKVNNTNELDIKFVKANEFRKLLLSHMKIKNFLFDSLFLILPVILTIGIFITLSYTYMLSIIFIYFILPMYFCFYLRVSYTLTGFGDSNYTYGKAYKDYFGRRSGAFSWIMPFFVFLMIYYFVDFIFTNFALTPLINYMYPQIGQEVEQYMLNNPNSTVMMMFSYLSGEIFVKYANELTRCFAIIRGLSIFIPAVCAVLMIYSSMIQHFAGFTTYPSIMNNTGGYIVRKLGKNVIKSFDSKVSNKMNVLDIVVFSLIGVGCYALGMYINTLFNTNLLQLVEVFPFCFAFAIMMLLFPVILVRRFASLVSNYTYLAKLEKFKIELSMYMSFNIGEVDPMYANMNPMLNLMDVYENLDKNVQNFDINEYMNTFREKMNSKKENQSADDVFAEVFKQMTNLDNKQENDKAPTQNPDKTDKNDDNIGSTIIDFEDKDMIFVDELKSSENDDKSEDNKD